jgi:hypothetical protein
VIGNNVVPLRRPPTKERALELIRAAIGHGGRLGWTEHVGEQLLERDIVDTQVLAVLAEAEIKSGPRWGLEYEDWVFTLTRIVSGRSVTVVIAIDEYHEVTVITAY